MRGRNVCVRIVMIFYMYSMLYLLFTISWIVCWHLFQKACIILIVWNIYRIFKYYVACEEGYTGQNCEIVCPFPSYGLDCQSVCNCTETTCDHVNGCKGYSSGIYCYNSMSQYAVFLVISIICKGCWTVIEHK